MISVTTVLLIRLIPYALVIVLAARKGFKWLTFFAFYLMCVAVYNDAFHPDAVVRGIISSFGAVFLLMHALNLRSRTEVRS